MAPPQPTDKPDARIYRIRLAQIAISGPLYMMAALWLAQAVGDAMIGSRLLEGPVAGPFVAIVILGIAVLPPTFLAAWIAVKATGYRYWSTWDLVWRWVDGVFTLWLASLFVGNVGLPLFIAFWLAHALLVTPKRKAAPADKAKSKVSFKPKVYPLPNDHKPQPSRRRHSRGGTVGNHGRIPRETEVLLKELVRQVTGTIVNGLPGDAPPAVRRATVRIVLEAVLQTWWDDQRVDPLDTIDVDRLKSAILLATDLADTRFDIEGQAIYRGVLRGLMAGWRLRRL